MTESARLTILQMFLEFWCCLYNWARFLKIFYLSSDGIVLNIYFAFFAFIPKWYKVSRTAALYFVYMDVIVFFFSSKANNYQRLLCSLGSFPKYQFTYWTSSYSIWNSRSVLWTVPLVSTCSWSNILWTC